MGTERMEVFGGDNTNSFVMKCDYELRYQDDMALRFNPAKRELKVVNRELLPIGIKNHAESYEMIIKFCASRILLLNRPNCKELLLTCGIDDQEPVSICIATRGLSFTDNYWISRSNHTESWASVNLFQNKFSPDISRVALKGNLELKEKDWDRIYTGELSLKGTRRKGIFRVGSKMLLYKNETVDEISSEVCSKMIADALNLNAAKYWVEEKFGLLCSVCELLTDTGAELISCREIMDNLGNPQDMDLTQRFFRSIDRTDFALMQVFDYLTLNSDRNRDNYGILRHNGICEKLYQIFDHDSCFKAKSINGIYFPTGKSFHDSMIDLMPILAESRIRQNLINAEHIMKETDFRDQFIKIKSAEHYQGLIDRLVQLNMEVDLYVKQH